MPWALLRVPKNNSGPSGITFYLVFTLFSGLISDEHGKYLVRLARNAVSSYLTRACILDSPEKIDIEAGIFVTLNFLTRDREEHLRGCIGFPIPKRKIEQAVIEASIAAATEDPRFPVVDSKELPNLIFEVSILTPPRELTGTPTQISHEIKIGRDGLILKWKYGSGLLLPQVPVELKWDVDEFLANICYKAGAPPDVLLDPASVLYTFQATVFRELTPGGESARSLI